MFEDFFTAVLLVAIRKVVLVQLHEVPTRRHYWHAGRGSRLRVRTQRKGNLSPLGDGSVVCLLECSGNRLDQS